MKKEQKTGLGLRWLWAVPLILIGGISYGVVVAYNSNNAFNNVQIGDSESAVINYFGKAPSVREKQGIVFSGYTNRPCKEPCVERLWYENHLLLDIEAWSIEMNKEGKVIDKAHLSSP